MDLTGTSPSRTSSLWSQYSECLPGSWPTEAFIRIQLGLLLIHYLRKWVRAVETMKYSRFKHLILTETDIYWFICQAFDEKPRLFIWAWVPNHLFLQRSGFSKVEQEHSHLRSPRSQGLQQNWYWNDFVFLSTVLSGGVSYKFSWTAQSYLEGCPPRVGMGTKRISCKMQAGAKENLT